MSGKMQAGKMKRTAQIAYQAFSRAVSANLHVFILWDLDSMTGSLFPSQSLHGAGEESLGNEAALRALFTAVYQRCAHVDHYQSWSKHAYSEIAMQWWQKGVCEGRGGRERREGDDTPAPITDSSAIKWQEWTETSSQLEAVSSLAAHIHIVTSSLLTSTYGELGRHLVTPKLFLDCLTMTQSIALKIKEKEVVSYQQKYTVGESLLFYML